VQLRALKQILQRRFLVIAFCTAASIVVALLVISLMTPVYASTTGVRVSVRGDAVDYGSLVYAERIVNTYSQLAVSAPVLIELQQRLGMETSIVDLKKQVRIDTSANSELIYITFEAHDPMIAAAGANTLAEILVNASRSDSSGRNYPLIIVDPASVPDSPDRPQPIISIALALLAGLMGGLALTVLLESLDTRIFSVDQVEAITGQAVIGQIPRIGGRQTTLLRTNNSIEAESFRQLRTSLLAHIQGSPLQTFLVTSAEPREGKSTVTANLAVSIAQAGYKTVVVDGDMRLPRLHRFFDVPNELGLSTVIQNRDTLDRALQQTSISGLHILASGPVPDNPAELLASPFIRTVCEELSQRFDYVLWDTPALLAVADARILQPQVDGALLVVACRHTPEVALRAAWQFLNGANDGRVEVVVNYVERQRRYAYYQRTGKATQRRMDHA
jgi:capsular exopolysaccharide synthesis family protein